MADMCRLVIKYTFTNLECQVTVNLKWQLYEQWYSSEENTKSRMFIAYNVCYLSSLSPYLHWLCSEHGSIDCAVKGAEEEMFYLLFYLLSCSLHTLHFHLLHDQWRELRGTAHSLGFYKMLLLNPYHSCYLLCRILSLWLHRSASSGQLHPARHESESACYQW